MTSSATSATPAVTLDDIQAAAQRIMGHAVHATDRNRRRR